MSTSSPTICPSFVVMFSGGMSAAVPTTSSFFAWIRSNTGETVPPAAMASWTDPATRAVAISMPAILLALRMGLSSSRE